jgi:hypothetical protein
MPNVKKLFQLLGLCGRSWMPENGVMSQASFHRFFTTEIDRESASRDLDCEERNQTASYRAEGLAERNCRRISRGGKSDPVRFFGKGNAYEKGPVPPGPRDLS